MDNINKIFKTFIIKESDILIENLSSYIYDYIKSAKQIKEEFIKTIIDIIVDIRKINNYYKDTVIDNGDSNVFAEYEFFECENKIIIYLKEIIDDINSNYKDFNIDDRKILILYEIIEICFHETEHIYQLKICNEEDDYLEKYILKISSIYKCTRDELEQEIINKKYCHYIDTRILANNQIDISSNSKFYYIKPEERLAELKSNIITLNIFLNIFKDISFLKKIGLKNIYNTISYGYDIYNIPLKEYMVNFNPFISFDEVINKTKELNNLEKAVYGLEIDSEKIKLINRYK